MGCYGKKAGGLTGAVKDEVVVIIVSYFISQPVEILDQILHTVNESSVGAILHVLHDLIHRNELSNICGGEKKKRLSALHQHMITTHLQRQDT